MSKLNGLPKGWEVLTCKILILVPVLGFGQLGIFAYIITLFIAPPPIIWGQVMLLLLLTIAINGCYLNAMKLLKLTLVNNGNSPE